jgi:hypothetical protein
VVEVAGDQVGTEPGGDPFGSVVGGCQMVCVSGQVMTRKDNTDGYDENRSGA